MWVIDRPAAPGFAGVPARGRIAGYAPLALPCGAEFLSREFGMGEVSSAGPQGWPEDHPATTVETSKAIAGIDKLFSFEGYDVRVVVKDNEPWFVLADVCQVLEIGNPRDVKHRLSSEDVDTVVTIDGQKQSGPARTIVNESGLYDVILDSRKPQAKQFRRWITSEVVPSIVKHGAYMTDDALERSIQNPDFMIGLLENLKSEQVQRKALEAQREARSRPPEAACDSPELFNTPLETAAATRATPE